MIPNPGHGYRSVTESVSGIYIILKPDFSIAEVSDKFLSLFKQSKGAILGNNLIELLLKKSENIDIKVTKKIKASLNYVIKQGKEHSLIINRYCPSVKKSVHKNKSLTLLTTPFFNKQNELTYIIHKIETTKEQSNLPGETEQKEPVQYYENNDFNVFFLDTNGIITSWNKNGTSLNGYSTDEIIGKPIGIIYSSADNQLNIPKRDLQNAMENGYYETESWRVRKDGSLFYAKVILTKQVDDKGRHTGFSKVVQNFSEKRSSKHHTQFLASLADNIKDPVISCDNTITITGWNNAAENLLGWEISEVLGKKTVDILTPIYNIVPREAMLRCLHEIGFWQGEAIYHTKSGKPIDVSVTISNITNPEGVITGSFAIIRDITVQKKYQETLQHLNTELEEKVTQRTFEIIKREKRFRSLIENSTDIIILLNESLDTIYCSPAARAATGFTLKECNGSKYTSNIHPDDILKTTALFQEIIACPGKPIPVLLRKKDKNGKYMWVEGVAKNLLQEEHVAAIVLNLRNVTERIMAEEKLVASENQFRSRLDNMIEGIQIHDFSWRYVYVNDALLRYTSFKKEDLIGFSLKEIYPGIENSDLFKTMQQCMNERLSVQTETEFVHPDGKVAFYQLSIKPVPEGIFILSIDITNRKKAERELIQSEENLKAIFDNSSEGFVLTDTEGIIKAVNTKANNPLLQYATGEIKIGQSIFNSTEPERQDFLKQIFSRIINGETIEYNRFYNAPNALQCWINYIYSPVKKNNTIQGVCITGRDITTRKLAEQQKEFDRNNLDALINNTADCIWSVDLNFNLITSNKAFNDRFEKLTGQMIEKGSNVLSEYFDSLQLEHYKNYYKYCFSGDAFTVVEHLKKPENRWSEISFQPIYEADKVIGAACFARDITQRKKIEQELKNSLKEKRALLNRMSAIINTLPANIALLDNKAVILDVNDSWRNFADNNKFIGKNYCIGQNYIDISNKLVKKENEDGPKVAIGIDAVLKGKLKEFVFEYECHSPEKERWFRMIVTPLQKEEYSGAVVMHIDISALRSLEKERLNAKTEAHQKITQAILLGQEKERNHIGRELHDNVNQILAASKLYLSSAANKNGDIKELLKYPLELLEISIEEIRLLCVNLVTPLRITSLKELTIGLLSKIQQSAAIETAYIYDVPENLLADELKLNVYRVLQELTNNIIKYAKAQKVSITINLTGKNLQIEITDDGVGFNINNSRKGIGISNIISRMESFNGKVNIISSPGNGCKTIITVPY